MEYAMNKVLILLCLSGTALLAQKDFLTADETDQVREAQDPNDRLKLYTVFARQRLDQAQHLVKEHKPGSAGMVHDLLDEYNKIIDAVDTVADDALQRKLDISLGIGAVTSAEKEFLPALEKIRDSQPKDMGRYEFVLSQAIDTTKDSLETSSEDLGKRSSEVADRERREKKDREAMMQPKDREEQQKTDAKQASDDKSKKKKPTLLKPGETVKQQ
jgi:hypothetical protein